MIQLTLYHKARTMAKKKTAKKKGGINKSELIRVYKARNPDAMPKDVAEALTKQHGVEFTNHQVNKVLHAVKKGNVGVIAKMPKKKASAKKPMANTKKAASDGVSASAGAEPSHLSYRIAYRHAIGMIEQVGYEQASEILSELSNLKRV